MGNPGAPGHEDQDSQAYVLDVLTRQVRANLSVQDPAKVCLGGTPFAWNDEWWKSGNPSQHDTDGFAGAIYMVRHATEEWWGLVDVARTPRKAYATLQTLYTLSLKSRPVNPSEVSSGASASRTHQVRGRIKRQRPARVSPRRAVGF